MTSDFNQSDASGVPQGLLSEPLRFFQFCFAVYVCFLFFFCYAETLETFCEFKEYSKNPSLFTAVKNGR